MAKGINPSRDWVDDYRLRRPDYENLATRFADLLRDLLHGTALEIVQIEHRAKTIDSFEGKLKRKGDRYTEPLEQVTDLAGIRIITYYLEDLTKVGDIIRREFIIDEDRSVSKSSNLDPDRFGYLSDHFIVSLNENRSALPEWAALAGLKAEIQVRTATQHAWAAVEHKLRYKSAREVPPPIARRLFRLSALFELADEQFADVQRVTHDVEREYGETLSSGNLSLPLDAASLEVYLQGSKTAQEALDVASRSGWQVTEAPDPLDPTRRERDLRDLARSLQVAKIQTIEDFDGLIARTEEVGPLLSRVAKHEAEDIFESGHPNGEAFPEDILNIVAFLLIPASPELVAEVYGGVTAEAINEAIGSAPR